jgi:hypothetical protein
MRKCNVRVNEQVDDAVMRWVSSVSLVCKSDRETTICMVSASVLLKETPDLSQKSAILWQSLQ